jgi:hypothetical protein
MRAQKKLVAACTTSLQYTSNVEGKTDIAAKSAGRCCARRHPLLLKLKKQKFNLLLTKGNRGFGRTIAFWPGFFVVKLYI